MNVGNMGIKTMQTPKSSSVRSIGAMPLMLAFLILPLVSITAAAATTIDVGGA